MSKPKEINMNPTPSFDGVKYFLNIPAFVAHDSRLKDPEKLLFGEILSMLNTTGQFFMNNVAVAQRLNKTTRAVKSYLSNLEKIGYIKRSVVVEEKTKEVKGRFIQLGDEYYVQLNKMKAAEAAAMQNNLPSNSAVVSVNDFSNPKGGGEQNFTRVVKESSPGGEQNFTRVVKESSPGGEQNFTHNRTLLKEHSKRTTSTPPTPSQPNDEHQFPIVDDVEGDPKKSQQPKSQTQTLESRFQELWAKYPAKIGYNEAFAAYQNWIYSSPSNTDRYLEQQLDKYLAHLSLTPWLVAMKPQKWFGGGFKDDYSYYDQHQQRSSQGSPGRKQRGRTKEQLPQWAQKNQKQPQEQATPEQIAQAKEALAKLRSAYPNQQEKRWWYGSWKGMG